MSPCRKLTQIVIRPALLVTLLVLGASRAPGSDFHPTAQATIVPPGAELELVWAEGQFTEGPTVAADGAILFSDIGNRIMRYDPEAGETTVFRADSGKSNGLMFDQRGQLIACEGANGGNRRISITDKSGRVRTLADRYDGKRFNSPNDLAIDARGRVYFTDPRYTGDEPRELEFEGVFLVDTDGSVKQATGDLQRPNGILVSQDGRTVYIADNHSDPNGNHHLTAFRVEPDGSLADKRILFDFGPNRRGIDGMTLDQQGNIYATAGGGDEAGVYVFSPDGKHLAFIHTPGDPTNCVFGGPNEPKALYVTAGVDTDDQPPRFGLYRIELAIPGYRIFAHNAAVDESDATAVSDALIDSALGRAAENRPQIQHALDASPTSQRDAVRFLIAYMPERDLQTLSAEYILKNVAVAYRAREATVWGGQVPEAIFFNDVLPYVSVTERRDDWRADFFERFLPLVRECQTPGEAAMVLNRDMFKLLDVQYHARKRPKPDQSPYESVEAKYASCSGLSILLIDACRAVCVPARFAGTPRWTTKRGNHSWVELWSEGAWHFTGACEYDPGGLNKAWFSADAAQARSDDPRHAIYASSWRVTGTSFPLVWARREGSVAAIDITDRYKPAAPDATTVSGETPENASTGAMVSLRSFLGQPRETRPPLKEQRFLRTPLSKADAAEAARLLWEDHAAWIRHSRAEEMEQRALTVDGKQLKFHYTLFGDKPQDGRSLYISLHGGGNTRPAVNDRQWRNQQTLYELSEGVYLAPRAPTNTWNLWHEPHIDPMFDRLIANLVVFEDVNPNRVYVMGYSAGGDGVYQLAPRMADRWAAAAMMAGHPNETSPLGLRNIGFALHVGANDTAYKRNEVAREWQRQLAELHEQDPEGYRHQVGIHEGKGHWMDREDAVAVSWMASFVRDLRPKRIVWRQDDVTQSRFYWLAVDDEHRQAGALVRADLAGQTIDVHSDQIDAVTVLLDDQMLDLDQHVSIRFNGQERFSERVDRTIQGLTQSLDERSDPTALFSARVSVER